MSRTARIWCALAAVLAGGALTFWAVAAQRMLDSVFESGPEMARVRWLTLENVVVFAIVSVLSYLLFSRLVTAIWKRMR